MQGDGVSRKVLVLADRRSGQSRKQPARAESAHRSGSGTRHAAPPVHVGHSFFTMRMSPTCRSLNFFSTCCMRQTAKHKLKQNKNTKRFVRCVCVCFNLLKEPPHDSCGRMYCFLSSIVAFLPTAPRSSGRRFAPRGPPRGLWRSTC